MPLDPSRVQLGFDALSAASDATFVRVAGGRMLRYVGEGSQPDLVDELSARLICSSLRSRPPVPVLVVLPDDLDRRSPLLFATALIMDSMAQIESRQTHRRVLYVANYPGIRSQLSSVRLGRLSLATVFTQQYGRGLGDNLRTQSLQGGANLPSVVCIYGPADARRLLREQRPSWVAVDCSHGRSPWLSRLLAEARTLGTPVVGWTSEPFSDAVSEWLACGGGLFRWPRVRSNIVGRLDDLVGFREWRLRAEVTPWVLTGEHVQKLSLAMARATEALLATRGHQSGRLAVDAVLVGWRYLRALEAVSVPIEVYERQVSSYWGMRPLAALRDAFGRFVEAVGPDAARLSPHLREAAAALSEVHEGLASGESPLWLGLANLCVEGGAERTIVFSSRARKEMFALCLLARFNFSEDDLRGVGIALRSLGQMAKDVPEGIEAGDNGASEQEGGTPVLVGLPSRAVEAQFEPLLQRGHVEVLLWPHQELVLERRLDHLARELDFACQGLRSLASSMDDMDDRELRTDKRPRAISLGSVRQVTAGTLGNELRTRGERVRLWIRPDAPEAVAGLFGSSSLSGDEDESSTRSVLTEDGADQSSVHPSTDDPWVQEAVEIVFEDGRRVLLSTEETVNVVVRSGGAAQVEQRYVRSLQNGDEVLFIQGQRRQSLYDLLVSRVHRDPVIAQYIALVTRWQDDFVRAYRALEAEGKISPERLLATLRSNGSHLTSPATIRTWERRQVLAPHDMEDLRRVAEALSLGFVASYYAQIYRARNRLKGLHINLSARLNRWLSSGDAGIAAHGEAEDVIDGDLGLTVEDFRHSLLRLRVREVRRQIGPFFRPHLGQLEGGRP